jgi:hypothetical protein
LQCVVLSTGRVERHYIISQEPELTDRLIASLVAVSRGMDDDDGGGGGGLSARTARRGGDAGMLRMPFELRMLETALDEASRLLGIEVAGVVHSGKERMANLRQPNVRSSC